jgi:hypothetical protein
VSLFLFHPPDRPDFRRTDWAKFETHLKDQIPFDTELLNGMAIDTSVENFSDAVLMGLASSTPKRRPRTTHGLRFQLLFRMRYPENPAA